MTLLLQGLPWIPSPHNPRIHHVTPRGNRPGPQTPKSALRDPLTLCPLQWPPGYKAMRFSASFEFLKSAERENEVARSCPAFCDPTDCSPPGSSVHGAFQARILEWVAISFSRGSSPPRDQTRVSHTAGRLFTILAITATPKSADPLRKRSCWRKLTFWSCPRQSPLTAPHSSCSFQQMAWCHRVF